MKRCAGQCPLAMCTHLASDTVMLQVEIEALHVVDHGLLDSCFVPNMMP